MKNLHITYEEKKLGVDYTKEDLQELRNLEQQMRALSWLFPELSVMK